MSDRQTTAQVVRDLTLQAANMAVPTDKRQLTIVPAGFVVHDNENSLPHPSRVRTVLAATTPDELVGYTKQFKRKGTAGFFNYEKRSICVVIDYHDPSQEGKARWQSHKLTYQALQSEEYQLFLKASTQARSFNHVEFAEFLQEAMRFIVRPAGADLIEAVTAVKFSGTTDSVSVVSVVDGQVELAIKGTQAASTTSKRKLPTQFTIQIPTLKYGKDHQYVVNLRYRAEGEGKVKFMLSIPQFLTACDDAFREECSNVRKALSLDKIECYGVLPLDGYHGG